MSFFSDFFNNVMIENEKNKIYCSLIFGNKLSIIGNVKIDMMSEDEIVLKVKKGKIKIIGSNLIISSMAKGQFEIEGNVTGVMRLWVEVLKLKSKV